MGADMTASFPGEKESGEELNRGKSKFAWRQGRDHRKLRESSKNAKKYEDVRTGKKHN